MKNLFLKITNKINKRSDLKNSFFLLVGVSISRVSILAFNFLFAFMLTTQEFGFFSILKSTSTTFTSIVMFLLNILISKNIAEQNVRGNVNQAVKNSRLFSLLVVFVGALVMLLLSQDLLKILNFESNYWANFLSIILLFSFSTISNAEISIIVGLKKTNILARANIFTLIFIPIVIFLAWKFSATGAIYGLTTYYFIQILFLRKFISAEISEQTTKNQFKLQWEAIFLYFKGSLPLFLITLLTALPFYIIKVFVYVDLGAEQLALFEFGYQWFILAITVINTVLVPILPSISESKMVGDNHKLINTVRTFNKLNLIMWSLFFTIGVFGAALIEYYFSKFDGILYLVIILLVSSLPYSYILMHEKILYALGRSWKVFFSYSIYFLAFVAIILSFPLDIYTLSWAMAFGYTLSLLFLLNRNKYVVN